MITDYQDKNQARSSLRSPLGRQSVDDLLDIIIDAKIDCDEIINKEDDK